MSASAAKVRRRFDAVHRASPVVRGAFASWSFCLWVCWPCPSEQRRVVGHCLVRRPPGRTWTASGPQLGFLGRHAAGSDRSCRGDSTRVVGAGLNDGVRPGSGSGAVTAASRRPPPTRIAAAAATLIARRRPIAAPASAVGGDAERDWAVRNAAGRGNNRHKSPGRASAC
jgi:hypothetical protein